MIYADSSFVVSLYLRDANSEAARVEIKRLGQSIALSRIAELEVRNAFRLAVYRKWISSDQEKRLQSLLDSDVGDRFLLQVPFPVDELFTSAGQLSERFTAVSGNRSLDVLHVAFARLIDLKIFATFDERQRRLAEEIGLRVVPDSTE